MEGMDTVKQLAETAPDQIFRNTSLGFVGPVEEVLEATAVTVLPDR